MAGLEVTDIKSQEQKIQREENVTIYGINFPKSYIKDYTDFTQEVKLGEGQFGAVYQGHLDIGPSR